MARQIFTQKINNPEKKPNDDITIKFFMEIESGDINKISDFVHEYRNQYALQDKTGNTPTHLVLGLNDITANNNTKLQLLKYLAEIGALIDRPNNQNVWPMHLAAQTQDKKIIEYLIGKKFNMNCKDSVNNTPLHYAVSGKKTECDKNIKPEPLLPESEDKIKQVNTIINDVNILVKESLNNNIPERVNKYILHIVNTITNIPNMINENEPIIKELKSNITNLFVDAAMIPDNKELLSDKIEKTILNFYEEIKREHLPNSITKLKIAPNQPGTSGIMETTDKDDIDRLHESINATGKKLYDELTPANSLKLYTTDIPSVMKTIRTIIDSIVDDKVVKNLPKEITDNLQSDTNGKKTSGGTLSYMRLFVLNIIKDYQTNYPKKILKVIFDNKSLLSENREDYLRDEYDCTLPFVIKLDATDDYVDDMLNKIWCSDYVYSQNGIVQKQIYNDAKTRLFANEELSKYYLKIRDADDSAPQNTLNELYDLFWTDKKDLFNDDFGRGAKTLSQIRKNIQTPYMEKIYKEYNKFIGKNKAKGISTLLNEILTKGTGAGVMPYTLNLNGTHFQYYIAYIPKFYRIKYRDTTNTHIGMWGSDEILCKMALEIKKELKSGQPIWNPLPVPHIKPNILNLFHILPNNNYYFYCSIVLFFILNQFYSVRYFRADIDASLNHHMPGATAVIIVDEIKNMVEIVKKNKIDLTQIYSLMNINGALTSNLAIQHILMNPIVNPIVTNIINNNNLINNVVIAGNSAFFAQPLNKNQREAIILYMIHECEQVSIYKSPFYYDTPNMPSIISPHVKYSIIEIIRLLEYMGDYIFDNKTDINGVTYSGIDMLNRKDGSIILGSNISDWLNKVNEIYDAKTQNRVFDKNDVDKYKFVYKLMLAYIMDHINTKFTGIIDNQIKGSKLLENIVNTDFNMLDVVKSVYPYNIDSTTNLYKMLTSNTLTRGNALNDALYKDYIDFITSMPDLKEYAKEVVEQIIIEYVKVNNNLEFRPINIDTKLHHFTYLGRLLSTSVKISNSNVIIQDIIFELLKSGIKMKISVSDYIKDTYKLHEAASISSRVGPKDKIMKEISNDFQENKITTANYVYEISVVLLCHMNKMFGTIKNPDVLVNILDNIRDTVLPNRITIYSINLYLQTFLIHNIQDIYTIIHTINDNKSILNYYNIKFDSSISEVSGIKLITENIKIITQQAAIYIDKLWNKIINQSVETMTSIYNKCINYYNTVNALQLIMNTVNTENTSDIKYITDNSIGIYDNTFPIIHDYNLSSINANMTNDAVYRVLFNFFMDHKINNTTFYAKKDSMINTNVYKNISKNITKNYICDTYTKYYDETCADIMSTKLFINTDTGTAELNSNVMAKAGRIFSVSDFNPYKIHFEDTAIGFNKDKKQIIKYDNGMISAIYPLLDQYITITKKRLIEQYFIDKYQIKNGVIEKFAADIPYTVKETASKMLIAGTFDDIIIETIEYTLKHTITNWIYKTILNKPVLNSVYDSNNILKRINDSDNQIISFNDLADEAINKHINIHELIDTIMPAIENNIKEIEYVSKKPDQQSTPNINYVDIITDGTLTTQCFIIENDIAKSFISSINLHTKNNSGDTPLHIAVRNSNLKLIKMLIKSAPEQIKTINNNNQTPLNIAKIKLQNIIDFIEGSSVENVISNFILKINDDLLQNLLQPALKYNVLNNATIIVPIILLAYQHLFHYHYSRYDYGFTYSNKNKLDEIIKKYYNIQYKSANPTDLFDVQDPQDIINKSDKGNNVVLNIESRNKTKIDKLSEESVILSNQINSLKEEQRKTIDETKKQMIDKIIDAIEIKLGDIEQQISNYKNITNKYKDADISAFKAALVPILAKDDKNENIIESYASLKINNIEKIQTLLWKDYIHKDIQLTHSLTPVYVIKVLDKCDNDEFKVCTEYIKIVADIIRQKNSLPKTIGQDNPIMTEIVEIISYAIGNVLGPIVVKLILNEMYKSLKDQDVSGTLIELDDFIKKMSATKLNNYVCKELPLKFYKLRSKIFENNNDLDSINTTNSLFEPIVNIIKNNGIVQLDDNNIFIENFRQIIVDYLLQVYEFIINAANNTIISYDRYITHLELITKIISNMH